MSRLLKLILVSNLVILNAFAIRPQYFKSKVLKTAASKASSNIDILKQELDLDLQMSSGLVSVKQVIEFETISASLHVNLDAGMDISLTKLILNSVPANYNHSGSVLTIIGPFESNQVSKLEIEYTFDLNSNSAFTVMKSQGKIWQASSFVQPSKAREWFVTNDRPSDKFQLEISAYIDEGFSIMSNGSAVEANDVKAPFKNHFSYSLKEPIPSYLVSLAIGEFHKVSYPFGAINMSYWVDEFAFTEDLAFFYETDQMMSFLESKLTPYPFEKYNITAVRTMDGGGMEHTTTTTLSSEAVFSHYGRVTSLHELAHHWFGDTVTCENWDDVWLNESFATFMELSYIEAADGKEAYLDELQDQREIYLNSEEINGTLGPIINFETTPEQKIFSEYGIVTYYKGSIVLNYLKETLGEKTFFQALGQYINNPNLRHNVTKTSDLKKHLEAESGRDLTNFFKEFIYRKGRPELLIEEVSNGRFKITQTSFEDIGLFHLDIPVVQGGRKISISSDKKESELSFVLPHSNLIYFDPDQVIPGIVKVKYQTISASSLLMQKSTSYRYAKRVLEELEINESEWRNLWVFSSLRGLPSAHALLLYGVKKFNVGAIDLLSAIENTKEMAEKRDLISAMSTLELSDSEKNRLIRVIENAFSAKENARFILTPLMKLANAQKINLAGFSNNQIGFYEKTDGAMLFKELLHNIVINHPSSDLGHLTKYLVHSFNKVRRRSAQVFSEYKAEAVTVALGESLLQSNKFSDYTSQDDYIISSFFKALESHHSDLAKEYLVRFKNSNGFSRQQIEQAEKILLDW